MVTEMQKKGLLSHQKIKCSFSDGLPEDWQKTCRRPPEDCQKTTRPSAERSEQKTLTKMQKNEKGPLNHRKIRCSFLDYIQLLLIGQVIQAKNINQNAKI